MRAVIVAGQGRDRRLEFRDDLAAPAAGPGEVVVRVRAAGLNRADLAMNARHRGGRPLPGRRSRATSLPARWPSWARASRRFRWASR